MNILFKNARIASMENEQIVNGDLLVKDNRIAFIGDSSSLKEKYDQIIECNGNVLMPGFKNAHTHSGMTFVRSKSDNLPLQDWLNNVIFPLESHLKEEDIKPLAKLAFLEYLTSGITCCLDQYFHPEIFAQAAQEFGMRTLCILIYNMEKRRLDEIKKLYQIYNTNKDNIAKIGVCIHAEYTSNKNDLIETKKILDYFGNEPCYSHLSETKSEVEDCYKRNGVSPVKYLDSYGLFDHGGAVFHCNYLSDEDIDIIKKRNLYVVTNPGSNLKLASGVADIEKYLARGLKIAIGTDGPASNNCLDFFKEMMLVTNLQKLIHKDPKSIPAFEVLKMATVNGAYACRVFDADYLEVGKLADIIMIDMHQPNMQPIHNVLNNIVYSGSKENIKMTMIDGKILYMDHKFYVNEDIEKLYEQVQKISERIIKETNLKNETI